MSDLVIRGLNLQQYALYSAEANALRQKWEMSGGQVDIFDEMMAVLQKYGQDPRHCMDESGYLNYHACGNIPEWLDVINKDPQVMVQYSQIHGQYIQQQMFGDASASGSQAIEGITLEKYAETAARLQHAAEQDVPGIVASLGYQDMNHYGRVRDGFTKAMEQDTSLKLSTHFGQLFAKYGQGHMQASHQHSVDLVAEAMEQDKQREQQEQQVVRDVMKMGASGQAAQIIPYLKKTFPDDAEDNDALDWYVDKGVDLFAEAGNQQGARALLDVRFQLVGDEDEEQQEWVNDELERLFS